MHLVHYNMKYKSFAEATSRPDGLAVLGVMLGVPSNKNTVSKNATFETIISQLGEVIKAGNETRISKRFRLSDLMPNNLDSFYRYDGSLTTPKFAEIVTWIVLTIRF